MSSKPMSTSVLRPATLRVLVDSVRGSRFSTPALIEIANGIITGIRSQDDGEVPDLDFRGYFAMPGLVDIHAHVGVGVSRYGMDRDGEDGVVALLSQGDAGYKNLGKFPQAGGPTTRYALHVEPYGEEPVDLPDDELEPHSLASSLEAESVWGISVNLSRHSTGNRGVEMVWQVALAAAESSGAPLLFGPRHPDDWPLDQQLDLLRPGDILTYMYRTRPYSLFSSPRTVEAVRRARDRGVILDGCHGSASLDFVAVEASLRHNIVPTTISSDLSTLCPDPSSASMPSVISKLVAAGLAEDVVLDASSTIPGRILGIDTQIALGAKANITVARWGDHEIFLDTSGHRRSGPRLQIGATISDGRLLYKSGR